MAFQMPDAGAPAMVPPPGMQPVPTVVNTDLAQILQMMHVHMQQHQQQMAASAAAAQAAAATAAQQYQQQQQQIQDLIRHMHGMNAQQHQAGGG